MRTTRILAALLLLANASAVYPSICSNTSAGLTPLTQLGSGNYLGYAGGLYANGANTRPAFHEAAGHAISLAVRPRNRKGVINPNGRIVVLSIGMSNTTQEFSTFVPMAIADAQVSRKITFVDGAQGGMSADRIYDLSTATAQQFWSTVDQRLAAAGVTFRQVQVVWLKQADAVPLTTFPAHADRLKTELKAISQILRQKFPHLKTVYLSSRIYGGYADNQAQRGEPLSYETGFAVKWLIADQIGGDPDLNYNPAFGEVRSAWLSWAPYIWADGTAPRNDGLFYACSDYQSDGVHPAPNGAREKVAEQLLGFFKTDPTTRRWFLAQP